MAAPVPTPVRFLAHHDITPADGAGVVGGYEPGDVAGLPAGLAAALIISGFAVAYPIPGLSVPGPIVPDAAAALAAADPVIDALGTGAMNPASAATLAAEAPAFFAAGKAAP